MNKNGNRLSKAHSVRTSRERRNEIRREVRKSNEEYINKDAFHILFIVSETENMERLLLIKDRTDSGKVILRIPIMDIDNLDTDMINETLIDSFGIKADSLKILTGTRIIVAKGLKKVNKVANLTEISVRPFAENEWLSTFPTTLNGQRIFGYKQLKKFFVLKKDDIDYYAYENTILELAMYKAIMGKIDEAEFLAKYRYFGIGWDPKPEKNVDEKQERRQLIISKKTQFK